MKYRRDFVTNSSSSNYICDVCGEVVSGYDMSLADAEMHRCCNGHYVCDIELLPPTRSDFIEYILQASKRWTRESLESLSTNELEEICCDYDFRWEAPESVCPICQFEEYSEADILKRNMQLIVQKFSVPLKPLTRGEECCMTANT